MSGDGSLCLRDGILSPDEFVELLIRLRHPGRKRRAIRLNLFLDCCHSGAFLLRVLSRVAGTLEDDIYIYTMWASCMPDENAWETDEIGHGLFTFCFSHRGELENVYTAEAIRPDNSFGPSLRIATGGYGCSIVSLGRQNPVTYMGDGTGSLEVCGKTVVLQQGPLDERALVQQLSELRLEFLQHSEMLRRELDWGRSSEEELRANLPAIIIESRNRR